MQREEVVNLRHRPRSYHDIFDTILERARGRKVLNVGASGGVEHYLPAQRDHWLHERLAQVASVLVGVDIDRESIAYAARHGVEIQYGDCETDNLGQMFDIIVMSDVIEHLNAPTRAIENLARHLADDGQLLVTTPNPAHYGLILRSWLGLGTSVYYDHTGMFMPEHVSVMASRLGLDMPEYGFFSHKDNRSSSNALKSSIAGLIGRVVPRSHSSMFAVIEKRASS